jgi:hypothetical protein
MTPYGPYASQDFVLEGSVIDLGDRERAWDAIDKRMRTAVRKAKSYNPIVRRVDGSPEDLQKFAEFCPNRKDLPDALQETQHMFLAYLGDELVGGTIVTEFEDKLYLHFHAATQKGKDHQIPSLLIWHLAETFTGGKFRILDVGASYRRSLQYFFQGWATRRYPIIMRPPELKPQWMVTPFDNRSLGLEGDPSFDVDGWLREFLGAGEFTFFPRAMYAVAALFRELAIQGRVSSEDEVYITTTTDTSYVSSRVTSAIEATCRWSRELRDRTRAIFVIHEFGFPHPRLSELRSQADERKIPLIEDCAYAWGTQGVGRIGDYALYSFTKFFPVQFGGLLRGISRPPKYVWENYACSDELKEVHLRRALAYHLPRSEEYVARRRENYLWYQETFGKEKTYFSLSEGVCPGAFVLRMQSEERMKEASEFVRSFGIECGNFWHNQALFFPVHQMLGPGGLQYIAAAIHGASGYREIVKSLKGGTRSGVRS